MRERLVQWYYAFWPPLPVWRRLDLSVIVVAVYTLLVEAVLSQLPHRPPKWIGELSVVNAVLLGVLLGFRNREAYERWWEGRKLWGQLINDSRNLALKAVTYANPPADERRRLGVLIAGFAVALKLHLRGDQKKLREVTGFEGETADPVHVPAHLAGRVFDLLKRWKAGGTISDIEFLALDPHARALMDVCGACERIRSTPVPLSYRSLLRHGTVLYLLSAPWFMATEFGYWAVIVVSLMAYFLLGTELTAEDVEEPFGRDADDLALGRYCETIRASCAEVLGVEVAKAAG